MGERFFSCSLESKIKQALLVIIPRLWLLVTCSIPEVRLPAALHAAAGSMLSVCSLADISYII